eukprot:1160727-Pelagomonas_calceolata.AAC.2
MIASSPIGGCSTLMSNGNMNKKIVSNGSMCFALVVVPLQCATTNMFKVELQGKLLGWCIVPALYLLASGWCIVPALLHKTGLDMEAGYMTEK